jgi:predicted DNA-binding transcriptional regulator YafY
MYHPTTRVLAVLEVLQARGRASGPDLAERLEVDERTIRRYVTMLQDLGIPVETERGRYGGYRLRPGYKLPPLMFSDDEALAVTLGLMAARHLVLGVTAPAVEGALAKVERLLPPALRQRVAAVQAALVTDLVPSEEAPATWTVAALSVAAQEGRRVWMRYASAQDEETERAFDPYGIVYLSGRWYAAGYCHLRRDLRTFRLDRVRDVQPREETFLRPVDFDSLAYVRRSLASMPGTWSVEVLLKTDLRQAERLGQMQRAALEETAEGVVYRESTENLDATARALVGLGCPIEVREPPELRAALRALAERIAAMAVDPPEPEAIPAAVAGGPPSENGSTAGDGQARTG